MRRVTANKAKSDGIFRRGTAIPRFALYGETPSTVDAEFVHIEDIESRSRRFDWTIGPHLHRGLFQAVVIHAGRAVIECDGRSIACDGPTAISMPPSVVHAFRFHPGTDGHVLTVAEALLADRQGPAAAGDVQRLLAELAAAPRVVNLAAIPEAAKRIARQLAVLGDEFQGAEPGRAAMLDWLARGVLIAIARLPDQEAGGGRAERRRLRLYARFCALVEQHFQDHWPVPRYAGALGVTDSRLDRLCRTAAGKSAFEVTQDRLLLEARRRLVYLAMPVASIAYELGFQDPAYFSRFFRRRAGETPVAFRRRSIAALGR